MPDIEHEIEKIKFHISLIGEAIDHRNNPITALVISMNWNAKDLDAAHDIFEKYDRQLESKEEVSWHAFEHELKDKFNIGYQTVKNIILAFYRNHQWTDVCRFYAKAYECVEFHEITKAKD